jgi:hypothetical protein
MGTEEVLQESFANILAELHDYLRPICDMVTSVLCPPAPSTPAPNPHREPPAPQETVVVLADKYLLQLPLESLDCLRLDCVNALSRDISLQMLYHRIRVEPPPGSSYILVSYLNL